MPAVASKPVRFAGLEKKSLRAAEQDRPAVATARVAWRNAQPSLDPARLVFLDETWVKTNLARTYGRCPRGQRLVAAAPHGHWKTTTVVAALSAAGLAAPMAIDGAVNGDLFLAYVRQVLVPSLRPGDVVVMDNLSSHKRAGVRDANEAVGCSVRYLPPYNPDLNPIEHAFSKLKALLRATASRTVEGLWAFLGTVLDELKPPECRNYLTSCGYSAATPA